MTPEEDRLIGIREVANMLGVSIDTLRAWDVNGKMRAVRTCGGHRRYLLSEVNGIVEQGWKNIFPETVGTIESMTPTGYNRGMRIKKMYYTQQQIDRLSRDAAGKGISVSEMVRRILDGYYENEDNKNKGGSADNAKQK